MHMTTEQLLAQDVLTMAVNGGMPDSYWMTDHRIARAAGVLGFELEEARAYAEEWVNEE